MLRTHLWGECLRVLTICGLLGLLLAAPAAAETLNVTIVNPSFEALDAPDVGTAPASRWSTNGLATFDPTTAQFTGTAGNNVQGEVPFGGQIGNLDLGRVLTQTLGVNAIAGATYNLNHFVGRRRDVGAGGTYRVELLEGANVIASQVVNASTLGFQASAPLSGIAAGSGQLTLRFTGLTGQAFIDMPTLTASATKIDVIPVVNASFSSPDVGDVATGSPAGWTATGLSVGNGVFDMGSGQFPGTAGNNVIGGASGLDGQVGNIEGNGGSLSQNLGVTITPNDTVFLNVAIGNRMDAGFDPNYTMQLLLDGVPFASATNPVMPADGEFLVAQLTGVAPSVGQLGIRFTSISGQTFLDDVNVYLVTAAVPEGNSLALFAVCGGLGMVTLGLRRTLVKRKS